jgi:RNA ligase
MAQIDFALFDAEVERGYLTVRKHPTADLFIFNYTAKCQYERYWTDITMQSRGLITDGAGNVKARPFRKFFNYEEHVGQGLPIPVEPFTVTEKMDGSLGILYFINHVPYVSTRGSFESEQAQHATKVLHEWYLHNVNWKRLEESGITLLWEIIYPENRIVVDYGKVDDLVLLTAINIETGAEYDVLPETSAFPLVTHYNGINDMDTLRAIVDATAHVSEAQDFEGIVTSWEEVDGTQQEGFVVRFQSGLRVKMKFADYVRLHRLLTGVNARNIWDMLRNGWDTGMSVDEMLHIFLERVPEEFSAWAHNTARLLIGEYKAIEDAALAEWERVYFLPTRKEQALALALFPHKAVVFKMLDGQPYAEVIWKGLRPSADRPFKEQGEGVA